MKTNALIPRWYHGYSKDYFCLFSMPVSIAGFEPPVFRLIVKYHTTALTDTTTSMNKFTLAATDV
jgi:hypothetical protein